MIKKGLSIFTIRPVITITILYAVLLCFLNNTGYFTDKSSLEAFKNNVTISGQIVSEIKQNTYSASFEFLVNKVNQTPVKEKTIAYIKISTVSVSQGDLLILTGSFRKPRSASNPGEFDYSSYLANKNIHTIFSAGEINSVSPDDSFSLNKLALIIQKNILKTINNNLQPLKADILSKMTIGLPQRVDPETRQRFTDAGVIHVLIVSGLNVAFIAAIFWYFFRIFTIPFKTAGILCIPFILMYVFVTGANPPVLRAAVMAVFVILSISLSRQSGIYQSLSLAGLIILIFDPKALFQPSFQLSFSATLGIVYLYPYIYAPSSKMPAFFKWFWALFSVSLSAQLGVLPLIIYYFNKISLISLVSNIIIVPLSGLIMVLGVLLSFAGIMKITFLISALAFTASLVLDILIFLVKMFSDIQSAIFYFPTPSITEICMYYISIISLFQIKKYPKTVVSVFACLFLFFISSISAAKSTKTDHFEINFLSIENSLACHIKLEDGSNWLFNAGSRKYLRFNPEERIISPYLWNNGIRSLNMAILSVNVRSEYIVPRFNPENVIIFSENDNFSIYKDSVAVSYSDKNTLISCNNKSILIMNESNINKIHADVLVVSDDIKPESINKVVAMCKPSYLIIAGKIKNQTFDGVKVLDTRTSGCIKIMFTNTGISATAFRKASNQEELQL